MSDNIPFEIQMEIIKWLPVKPLIQFRSVSKPWKSFIDSSEFIKGYGARHTQPHSFILSYKSDGFLDEPKYICLVDDDNSETFKVDLPDSLMFWEQNLEHVPVSLSKLRGCLVVYGSINVEGAESCGVWVMQHDSSFKKLFSIDAQVDEILGFRDSGEPIFETPKEEDKKFKTLDVYDPCSQQISNLGIDGVARSFFMGSYKESLLLLDHSDLHIYGDDN